MVAQLKSHCACFRAEEWRAVPEAALPPSLACRANTVEVSSRGKLRRTGRANLPTQRGSWGVGLELVLQQDRNARPFYALADAQQKTRRFVAANLVARVWLNASLDNAMAVPADGDEMHLCYDNLEIVAKTTRNAAIRAAYDPLCHRRSIQALARTYQLSTSTIAKIVQPIRGKVDGAAEVRALVAATYDPARPASLKPLARRLGVKYTRSLTRHVRGQRTAYLSQRNAAIRAAYDPFDHVRSTQRLAGAYNLSRDRISVIVADLRKEQLLRHPEMRTQERDARNAAFKRADHLRAVAWRAQHGTTSV